MKSLADATSSAPLNGADDILMADDGDDYDFFKACLTEIDKQRRRDEWIPTYHNILSTTALACRHQLAKSGCIAKHPVEFLQYAQQGGFEDLRIAAFDHLLDLGYGRTDALVSFFLSEVSSDPSPYVRQNIIRLFGQFLGTVAIGVDESSKESAQESQQSDTLVIEQEGSTEGRKAALARRQTVPGALKALKMELESNQVLKEAIWGAVCSPMETLPEIEELLLVCRLLYDQSNSMLVTLQYPRYWQIPQVEKVSSGTDSKSRFLLKFKKGRVRTAKRTAKWIPPAQRPPTVKRESSTNSTTTRPTVLKLKTSAPPNPSPTISTPSAGQPKLKLVFKGAKTSTGSPLGNGSQTPR